MVQSRCKYNVLDDGRITEQGVHDMLIAKQGVYAKMFQAQMELEEHGRGLVHMKNSFLYLVDMIFCPFLEKI